jgi:hypothetical protein
MLGSFRRLASASALALLLGGATLLALAGAAQAHPVHNGCNPPQVWADAYARQLIGPVSITYTQVGPVRVPVVNLWPGDPESGIVCVP